MTDETTNIVLEQLRYIRKTVDKNAEDMNDLKCRVSSLEQSTALLHVDLAHINYRLDNFDKHLDRIDKRLDLQD